MELINLQGIFNERLFRIPDYQRGYSWGEQQLRDLWRDVDILENGKDHYTGMLSVVERKDSDYIFIVDGQQRITSLIILIYVICHCKQMKDKDWINGKEKKDYVKKYLHIQTGAQGEITESIFGYDKDNPSHIYFQKNILGLYVIESSVPDHTLYTHNLERAKEFFEDKIKNMNFKEVETLLIKITEKLKFNYYLIDSELNEFVAFETMNNRGKPLSSLELLKNRLIYLSTLLEVNSVKERNNLRDDINNAWKIVYQYLGRKPDKTIDDDDFLKDHWIMNFRYNRGKSNVYRDFLLNEYFTAEQVSDEIIKYKDIRDYAYDIQQAVKAYYYMHNPDDSGFRYSEEIKGWLSKLNRLGFGAFKPLITSMLMHLTNNNIEEETIKLLKFAERFSFVAFNIGLSASNYKNFDIYYWTHEYHKNKCSLANMLDEIHAIPALKKKHFSKDEFYGLVYEKYDGFYKWKGLEYFLYEYELHLQETVSEEMKVEWEHVNTETIEHILPQTPKEGEWDNFENQKDFLHDLGNLLLLSRKTNSKLSNSPFSDKKERFRNGSYSAIKVAEYDDWTPESIEDREKKMLCFMVDRWELTKL